MHHPECKLTPRCEFEAFGVLYPAPAAPVTLAPAYDQVTSTAYLQHDVPALTLAGSKKWWSRPMLAHFAVTRLALSVGMVHTIIERASDAVADTRHLLTAYQADRPEFRPIGEKMLAAWEQGMVGAAVSRSIPVRNPSLNENPDRMGRNINQMSKGSARK